MRSADYDLVVIGAGPSGLIWVNQAMKLGKRVLLIDQNTFKEPTYSSLGIAWNSSSSIELGGIGGTANAWQGQCVQLDNTQFSEIFPDLKSEDYEKYQSESKQIARLLSIRINNRADKLERIARKELPLSDSISIKFSWMPIQQEWRKIFRDAINYEKLHEMKAYVNSLSFDKGIINKINLSSGQVIRITDQTKVVIATNSVETARIVNNLEFPNETTNEKMKILVYDHPWRTRFRFMPTKNKFVRRKIFSYHRGFHFRMKSKYKFEVVKQGKPIGVFELRPEFKGTYFSKLIARFSQKMLGYSVIKPSYVDVWCQIAQVEPFEYSKSYDMSEVISARDLNRLVELEEESKSILLDAGFEVIGEHQNLVIEQAFHTTGTLNYSTKSSEAQFRFPGVSNYYENLYVSGGAGLMNCSWVNPTFSIMVLASINAKEAFQEISEI